MKIKIIYNKNGDWGLLYFKYFKKINNFKKFGKKLNIKN